MLAWKLLIMEIMNNGHISVSQTAAISVSKSKTRKKNGRPKSSTSSTNGIPHLAAIGSLTRTKALLLAALRVWELKHRIGE